jgi:hypothetical protein
MHVAELENKMKQNSLDSTGSRKNSLQLDDTSNSSFSSHDAAKIDDATSHHLHHLHHLKDRGDNGDLANIQRQIRDSIMHRESMLDEICDTLVDKDSFYSANSTAVTRAKYTNLAATVTNGGNRILPEQSYQIVNNNKAANGHAAGAGAVERKLDPKKKSTLLAVLKNIDNSSIEN